MADHPATSTGPPVPRARLFLSYGRLDDEAFVRQLHADLTARAFDVWFDRMSMPSRRLTFLQEIRDAIAGSDRLVLVVGPSAATSDYVRQEWQFAWFEADKVVTPILRLGDYTTVPEELKLLHCEDFRDDREYTAHLDRLVRILCEPPPALGKLIAVPSLPAHFMSRSAELTSLRETILADLDRPVVKSGAAARVGLLGGGATRVGLHGMAGIGKSVLAAALARDRMVREAFPDGVVWIGLGELPDLRARMQNVHRGLGGEGAIATEHEGKKMLSDQLRDKAALLIIDDAWRPADVDAFDVLGPRCRALVVARDARVVTALGGTRHVVGLLTDTEALRLLAVAAGIEADSDALPPEAREVLDECGRLPLAIALAGGMVRTGVSWGDLLGALRAHDLEFMEDRYAASEQHTTLLRTIETSVRALSDDVKHRLAELAVFPADESVPEAAVTTLWKHTGELSPRHSRKMLVDLEQRSLVQLARSPETDAESVGKVSLHDLIHDYFVRFAEQYWGGEAALHARWLDAYRRTCSDGWWDGPDDGYFLDHLRDHLVGAGRGPELAELLHELRWLEVKGAAGLAFDLPHDFRAALSTLPLSDDRRRTLRLLNEALRRDLHFIDRHREDYPQGLFQCLWNSCWWYDCPEAARHYQSAERKRTEPLPWELAGPTLHTLLVSWRASKTKSAPRNLWLRSLRPPSVPLGGPQRAVLRGHQGWVTSGVYSPDGLKIASGSVDETVRVWGAESGLELLCCAGHKAPVTTVAFTPEGRRIVSASLDRTVRVWDLDTGKEILCLHGHLRAVTSVAVSPNGKWLVSGSQDRTVRVWDIRTGAEMLRLHKHDSSVHGVAISPDGRRLVSGSFDHTVRVWDASTAAPLLCLRGHEFWVTSVACSPDGQRIASGSVDQSVRVWDVLAGRELMCLRGHQHLVTSVAWSPDGRWLVSGSRDQTVRVWDARTGAEVSCLRGHDLAVSGVAFAPDCRDVLSVSHDQTVRVWDAVHWGTAVPRLLGHQDRTLSVAFSSDGSRIVTGGQDGTARVWDSATGEESCCFRGDAGPVHGAAFAADGRQIVVAAQDGSVRVWDAGCGAELLCAWGHEGAAYSVVFSPDGRRIGSGSWDRTVRLWDADSGAELACLRGHEGPVHRLEFAPNGQRLISESWDGTARVWDVRTGECLEVVPGRDAAGQGPLRAVARALETVIVEVGTGQLVSFFPLTFAQVVVHPTARVWAAIAGNDLYLVRLEGELPATTVQP
jgi:WD40 repeat protein